MLSKKLTFSLTSLIVLLAFGFICAVPSAIGAEWWQYQPEATLTVADVSNAPGNQVQAYGARTGDATGFPLEIPLGAAQDITTLFIKVTKGQASVNSQIDGSTTVATGVVSGAVADQLDISDLRFTLLDKDGVVISTPNAAATTVSDYIGLFGTSGDTKIEPVHTVNTGDDGKNFKVTIDSTGFATAAAMLVHLPAGSFRNIEPTAVAAYLRDAKARATGTNKKSPDNNLPIILVPAEPENNKDPEVVSIVRIVSTAPGATSRFQEAQVSGPFQVRITLTEEGKDFAKDGKSDYIDVKNGTLTSIVPGVPFIRSGSGDALVPPRAEGQYTSEDDVPLTSGRDRMYHPYLVTIEPNLVASGTAADNQARSVEIRVKAFDDLVIPANSWVPPTNLALAANRSLLSVPINPGAIQTSIFKTADDAKTGNEIFLPDSVIVEPGEYLVVARGANASESGIVNSPAKDADKKTAAQMEYTTVYGVDFPYPGDNLEIFFRNGGQIALLHEDIPDNNKATKAENNYAAESKSYTAGALVISEIMWGIDQHIAGKDDRPQDSQWIELLNTTDATIHIDKSEWTLAFYSSAGSAPSDAIDVVGNANPYWQVKGSSGATQGSRIVNVTDKGTVLPFGTAPSGDEKIVSTTTETYPGGSLASMYRAIPADKKSALDGTLESSWTASPPQGTVNLEGLRYGTPGGDNPAYTAPVTPPPVVVPPPKAPAATASDLMISEVMVVSNGGRLPQWIEIANVGVGEVSLTGWSISIDNDPMDDKVIAPSVNLKLGDVVIGKDQVALVVSKSGRNSGVGTAEGNLRADRIIDVQKDVSTVAQYSLISEMAFRISLIPPLPSGVVDRGDVVGNLGQGWELPISEGSRSSLIRREMGTTAEIMGTDAAGWVLASDTSLVGAYVETYYGDKDDMGTPGYDAGGALPVELSKFSAARDRVTGQVTIAWETQSELNNAGFFIKRSQQRNGQFTVVNPTMIPGAGTVSEKQSYTYTDTTAKPNIVYYYQIEDVSLDGQRQTLTRAHRLKGHIGAAGKATTTWGELKTSLEQ